MRLRLGEIRRGPRAGNAGLIASFIVAIAGASLGTLATFFFGELGPAATAARPAPAQQSAAFIIQNGTERDKIVRRMIKGLPPERFRAPETKFPARNSAAPVKPKIVIILDDMGVDPSASAAAIALPGPITYSFLPYATDVGAQARRAQDAGGEVMLHLPMAPRGSADPGPNALRSEMSGAAFLRALEWNLSRFDGYAGVNNHMGSSLTADEAAMKTVLAYLKQRDVFFVDSVTTGSTVARRAGRQVGAKVLTRDVFLDPTPGDADEVRRQLELVERIAKETGYVVAIGHPRMETLAVLGPWITSAKLRGFELTTPSALLAPEKKPVLAAAPELRG